jgi:hypothetical protein
MPYRPYQKYFSGGTLIEVMLAVALTAITALGLIATQLWMARHANAMAARERTAFVAGFARGGDARTIGERLRFVAMASACREHVAARRSIDQWTGCRRKQRSGDVDRAARKQRVG